jgi:hypothetical protein
VIADLVDPGAWHDGGQARAAGAGAFAAGVALGVMGWFALLLWAIGRWRGALRHSAMNAGVRLEGGVLVGLGLVEGGRLLAG